MTSLAVAIMPLFISTLMTSTARRAMRLASSATVMVSGMVTSRGPAGPAGWLRRALDALQVAAEGRDRAHALVVVGERRVTVSLPRRRMSAPLRARRLGGRLAALLRSLFLFLDVPGGHGARRVGRRGGCGLFLLLEPASGFLFGVAAGGFFGRLARFFFGFALLGRVALLGEALFFDGAVLRVFLGALARFFFGDARIGEGARARFLFFFRQFAQHHPGAVRIARGRAWLRRGGFSSLRRHAALAGLRACRPAPARRRARASSPPPPLCCGHG